MARGEPGWWRRWWRRRWFRRTVACGAVVTLLLVIAHECVVWSVADSIFTVANAPTRDVILVLGASVRPGGHPSPMLAERLRAAAELYHAGKARKIIVSGDHGRRGYDEVQPMANDLEARGVPPRDIFLDHAGFRTLDSVARAQAVFGAGRTIVVSNPFHVARAVFLARSFGLDAVGVGADYDVFYSRGTRVRHQSREIAARVLAFADVYLFGTKPRTLGPSVDLTGDGRVTRRPRP